MDLKNAIISITIVNGVSKEKNKPYTAADIVFKGENGTVISKRVFFQEFEKKLLDIA